MKQINNRIKLIAFIALIVLPFNTILAGNPQRAGQAGVSELLIISQDTSAYGVDIKYRTGFWDGKPIKSNLYELTKNLE